MTRTRPAVVFPGQGTLEGSKFRTGALRAEFRRVLEEVRPAGERLAEWGESGDVVELLLEQRPSTAGSVALFVFAASVAHYRALVAQGERPLVLLGHGFGELAALTCAGALEVDQGAEIVWRRTAVLDRWQTEPGSMLTVSTTAANAERLVDRAGRHRAAVAAENSPTEVVISGTRPGVDSIRNLARTQRIAVQPLNARWPLHFGPSMRGAATALGAELRRMRMQQPAVAVYSPLLGRYYTRHDTPAECVARHLTERIRFADAVRALWLAGIESFIQCGPLGGLARAVGETVTRLRLDTGDRPEEVAVAPPFAVSAIEHEEPMHEAALAS
jgi:acyl transferase domain-containing protein